MKGVSIMEMGTIVPIVVALLLFFGAVVSAMNTVEEKNAKIDMVFSLIQIVDRITEAGIITGDRFRETVDVLKETIPVNFYVCVTNVNDNFSNCVLEGGRPYSGGGVNYVTGKISGNYLSAVFPVLYQESKGGVPFNEVYKMVVVVWQGA